MLELLNKHEAAVFLKVSERKIDYLREKENLPSVKIGQQVRFSRDAVENWVKGLMAEQNEAAETEDKEAA